MKNRSIHAAYLFHGIARLGGYALLVAGAYLLLISLATAAIIAIVLAFLLLFMGALAAFTRIGVEFALGKRQFRKFTSYVGFKRGKWMNMDQYPDLVIKVRTIRSGRNVGLLRMGEQLNTYYDLCMVNSSHLKQLVLKRCDSKEQAEKFAKQYAQEFQLNFTTFNPQVSQQTRNRRYRR